uniref:Uncharacterized protein n=1 Tax=Meloidogyne incognita TaxID=6306 RepID=A0A914LKM8_MELIC
MDSTYAHSTTTITATRLGANLRNMFINVINHRETNFIITSFIIFAALYASLTAIFERSLLHPLTITQQKQQIVYPPQLSLTPQLSNYTLEKETHFKDFPFSSPFRQCRRPNSEDSGDRNSVQNHRITIVLVSFASVQLALPNELSFVI